MPVAVISGKGGIGGAFLLCNEYLMPLLRLYRTLLTTIVCCTMVTVCSAATDVDSAGIIAGNDSPDPIFASDTTTCTIPFTRVGNLILVQGRVDGVEGNFILDTGAPYLVLNVTYFRNYPTTHKSDGEVAGANGPVAQVDQTTINEFSFGTLKYRKVEADLINLGHLENTKNVKILGLIGMQFLKQCEMIIDYERSVVHFHYINRKEASTYGHALLADTAAYNVVPIELMNDKIVTSTEVAGKKIKLMVDCGAETSMLDSRLPDKVLDEILITGRILVNGNGNSKIEAVQGEVMSMKVGKDIWSSVPVVLTNMEKSCLSSESCIKGILGFDFLSLKKVGFNFVKRKMYIWK